MQAFNFLAMALLTAVGLLWLALLIVSPNFYAGSEPNKSSVELPTADRCFPFDPCE